MRNSLFTQHQDCQQACREHLKACTSIWKTSHSSRCRASLLVAAEGPPSASEQITVSSSVRPAALRSSFCARLSGWSGSSDCGDGNSGPAIAQHQLFELTPHGLVPHSTQQPHILSLGIMTSNLLYLMSASSTGLRTCMAAGETHSGRLRGAAARSQSCPA